MRPWPLLLLLAGCPRPAAPAADAGPPRFHGHGVVRGLPADGALVLAHDDVPGLMPAMTMPFPVRAPALLGGLSVGDEVNFTLSFADGVGVLEAVERLGRADAGRSTPEAPHALDTLRVGDSLPDAPLTDSTGAAVHLTQWQGQVVAVTFVFTQCPFAAYCPRLSQTFAAAQKKLAADRFGWHLVSISFDPLHDVPAMMAAYGQKWGADPARWSLLTGDPAVIDGLCERFDVERVREKGQLQHTLRTAVVAPDGRIHALFTDSSFTAGDLVKAMEEAAQAASTGSSAR
jgi:protein SCO1/2